MLPSHHQTLRTLLAWTLVLVVGAPGFLGLIEAQFKPVCCGGGADSCCILCKIRPGFECARPLGESPELRCGNDRQIPLAGPSAKIVAGVLDVGESWTTGWGLTSERLDTLSSGATSIDLDPPTPPPRLPFPLS